MTRTLVQGSLLFNADPGGRSSVELRSNSFIPGAPFALSVTSNQGHDVRLHLSGGEIYQLVNFLENLLKAATQ